MTEPAVLTEVDGGVITITINRPDKKNAVNREVRALVSEAIDRLESESGLRVGIITGAGSEVFCAGLDLIEARSGVVNPLGGQGGGFAAFARRPRTKPVIAAVNGAAIGGGFELVLACDLVVISSTAWFALTEVLRGLVPGGGGAVRLPQQLPKVLANRLLLTGERLSAQDALRWGLANELVEPAEVLPTAISIAGAIAAAAPLSVTGTLAIADAARSNAEAAVWQLNDSQVRFIRTTEDAQRGRDAFAEKRAPEWIGK